jgi:hypothetical protein
MDKHVASPESESVETSVLEHYGMRWAVLAAWFRDLTQRGIGLDPAISHLLEVVRVKITTGVFSSCEVGCDLGRIEGDLVSRTTSSVPETVSGWFDAWERAMTSPEDIRGSSWFLPLQVPFVDGRSHGCDCPI